MSGGTDGVARKGQNGRALWALAGLLAVAAALWLSASASAATNVPAGTIAANDTWTVAGSPYTLGGDVTVAAGVRLQITGGASVEAPSGVSLIVAGQLDAVGSSLSRIEFRPSPNNASWGGIQVTGAGRARIENATITNPSVGVRTLASGPLNLTNVQVAGTQTTSVWVDGGSGAATLLNVSLAGGTYGLRVAAATGALRVDGLVVSGAASCVLVNTASNASLRHLDLSACSTVGLKLENDTNLTATDVKVSSQGSGVNSTGSRQLRLSTLHIDAVFFCINLIDGADNWLADVNVTTCAQAVVTEGTERNLLIERLEATSGGQVLFYQGTNLTLRDSDLAGSAMDGVSNRWIVPAPPPPPPPPPPAPPPDPVAATVRWGKVTFVTISNVTIEGRNWAAAFENTSDVTLRRVDVPRASYEAVRLRLMTNVTVNSSHIVGTFQAVYAETVTGLVVETSTLISTLGSGTLCTPCTNATFRGNTFSGNNIGLRMVGGSGGLVTRNLFLYNTVHAQVNVGTHMWDDGAVGNLWDDYTGVDANSDGIGDTPYPIVGGVAVDRYPIMRYPDFELPVADAGPDRVVNEHEPVWFNGWRCSDNVAIRLFLWSSNGALANFTIEGYDAMYIFDTPGEYEVTLTVIDWGGNRAQDTLNVFVRDITPPVAHAGGNRTVDEDTPAVFDGSASTDNDPVFPGRATFQWTVFDRTGQRIVYGLQATYTFAEPGNFTVVLLVRDGSGRTSQDRFYVNVLDRTPPVLAPLTAPVAWEDFPFRAYGSIATDNDPDWPLGMVAWFELWQDGRQLDNTTASPAIFNVAEPGFYTLWYYVSDASGNTAGTDLTFPVGDGTPPDLSALQNRTAELARPIEFNTSFATDNDPTFADTGSALWTVPVPSGRVMLVGRSVTFTFPSPGRYTLWVEVSDRAGNAAKRSFLVTVVDSTPPTIHLSGPAVVELGSEATYWVTADDPSGVGPVNWVAAALGARVGPSLTIRPPTTGTFSIIATVTDGVDNSANATLEVEVVDATAPRIGVACAPGGNCTAPRLTLGSLFTVAFIGPDAVAGTSVSWSWGDGANGTGFFANHTYGAAGMYIVNVTATDEQGNANRTTFTVEVLPPPGSGNPPPGGNLNTTPTSPTELPLAALIALIAGATAGGLLLGFRRGRARRAPPRRRA